MNTPGQPTGNWAWRFTDGALTHPIRDRLADITFVYARGLPLPEAPPEHRRRHHVRTRHTH